MSDKEFINSILVDENVDAETASFLMKYIGAWISDKGIDINSDTLKKMNENKDLIDKLKVLYSKEKIIDTIERKIILSNIAKGNFTIEQARNTKTGITYVEVEPTFGERIAAINALNALDAIDSSNGSDRILIIDNISEDNAEYIPEEELDEQ
jgi:hypothetical protein